MQNADNTTPLTDAEKQEQEAKQLIKNFKHDSMVRDNIHTATEQLLSISSHVTEILETSILSSENNQQNTTDKILQEVLGIIKKNIENAVFEIKPLFVTLDKNVNKMEAELIKNIDSSSDQK